MFCESFQVTFAVLQLLNEVVKDNTEFQENACLVGLVSSQNSSLVCYFLCCGKKIT